MGRRNVKGTKSGKFMNPTDQARKEARKKELKKNKKQRLLVRTAVLKNKDPGVLIRELDKLDEIEYNTTEAPALADKVLKDKRKKLKETLDRVMKLYQKENPTYWGELKRVEADYERRRFHRIQYFEAVKQAESVSNVEDIPLPDIPAPEGGELGDIPLPEGPAVSAPPMMFGGIPLPPPPTEVQSILKKAPMVSVAPGTPTFHGRDPPGVPSGPPPDLSEMDDLSDEEVAESEPEAPKIVDNKSKGVRFSDGKDKDDKAQSEMDRFMKEVEEEFSSVGESEPEPPGIDLGGGKTPEATPIPPPGHEVQPEEGVETQEDGDVEMSEAPAHPVVQTETAASAASAIAAAAGRPPPPGPFYHPPPPGMPGMPPNRMRFPPPLPPHMMRPGFGPPPGQRHMGSYIPQGGPSRFRQPQRSEAQTSKSDNKVVSGTMIQAKPQIRSLSADVTRFIPTVVKTKKEEPERPKRPEYQIGQSQVHFKQPHPPKQPQQSKDDAYADFMKEMQGLM